MELITFAVIASLVTIVASAVIWSQRTALGKWPWIHLLSTVIVVHGMWGVTWIYNGLQFWYGFFAPTYMTLKASAQLLPVLLKAI